MQTAIGTKEKNKAQRVAEMKAMGASNKRIGLIVKLVTVAILAALAFGAFSLVSIIKGDAGRVQQAVDKE